MPGRSRRLVELGPGGGAGGDLLGQDAGDASGLGERGHAHGCCLSRTWAAQHGRFLGGLRLADVVRELDRAGVAAADVRLRRPTLDEVFMRLTDRKELVP